MCLHLDFRVDATFGGALAWPDVCCGGVAGSADQGLVWVVTQGMQAFSPQACEPVLCGGGRHAPLIYILCYDGAAVRQDRSVLRSANFAIGVSRADRIRRSRCGTRFPPGTKAPVARSQITSPLRNPTTWVIRGEGQTVGPDKSAVAYEAMLLPSNTTQAVKNETVIGAFKGACRVQSRNSEDALGVLQDSGDHHDFGVCCGGPAVPSVEFSLCLLWARLAQH